MRLGVRRGPWLFSVSSLAAVVAFTVAGCGGSGQGRHEGSGGGSEPAMPESSALALDFEKGLQTGQRAQAVDNTGTADVQVAVHSSGEADVDVVKGPDGGHAIRFPAYTGLATAPAAVLVVTTPNDPGLLDPGSKDFSFGATFELDKTSSGSAADNGDNLVQSGTFDSPGQFKIQMDHDVPSCRIKGDQGEVFVSAPGAIDPGAWYSVTCSRSASGVSMTVKALVNGAGGGTWTASGSTGSIATKDLPLTIGGKTGPDGTPVASADQFNGAVDNVFLKSGS